MSKPLLNKTKLTVTVNIISRENVRHEFDAVYIAWRDFNFLLSLGEACKFHSENSQNYTDRVSLILT